MASPIIHLAYKSHHPSIHLAWYTYYQDKATTNRVKKVGMAARIHGRNINM